ncbi:helix-turn-helix transcriptional regulator [Streptomyces sp. NPDC048172]|uniref:helix-turn-helix transcriptional regulator n=1 Tax=Streptomyces sp. NPDC048172 TaxID=3365505 RepID=UPI00371C3A81
MTTDFESDDLDVIEDHLSDAYGRMRLRTGHARPRAHIAHTALGGLGLAEVRFGFEMDYAVEPTGAHSLGCVHGGAVPHHTAGDFEASLGPGDVALFAQPDQGCAGHHRDLRYTLISLPPPLLDQVAATAPGRRAEPLRFLGCRPVSPAAGRHLRRTIAYLCQTVRDDAEFAAQPLVAAHCGQLLAASVLAAFPNTALTDPTAADRRDACTATVRRAVSYIEEHADSAVAAADIAAAAHVTLRTLQYAFRRHLDTTPVAYLRRVRLARAHADLRAADPTRGATVSMIAARWGFLQTGRFAAAYRHAYGVPPSHTLHHAG